MNNAMVYLAILLLIGCNTLEKAVGRPSTEKSEIENIRWTLIEFEGKPIPEPVAGKVYLFLSNYDKSLSGFTGCNRLSGTYSLSNGLQLNFSDMATTRMACQYEGWDEMAFNKTLKTSNNFTTKGNKLMLYDADKGSPSAVFIKFEDDGIVNKYWKLKELQGKEVEMKTNQEREQYIIVRLDGAIQGFAGCNQFGGKYILEEDRLRITFLDIHATERACPELDTAEASFLKVLEMADNYTVNLDTLRLHVGKRGPLAVFEVVYFR